MSISRRRFLDTGLCAAVGSALVTGASPAALGKPRKLAVRLDLIPALRTVGGWSVAQLKQWKILFVRTSESEVKAFHPYCTHRKCAVSFNPKRRRLDCTCHGSRFDLAGRVLAGPATASLPTYPCWLQGDRVIVQVPS